tara:strand:- start:156 stop:434 length:279 start_codon:yes stop_codon:yes gene_type:complete
MKIVKMNIESNDIMQRPVESKSANENILRNHLSKTYGPLMDLDDLANTLRLKKTTLYQRIYLNKLNLPRIKNGKKYLFQTTDVATFILSESG